ncbi:MAG: ATP-binding protein [Anaerolineae bacterium]
MEKQQGEALVCILPPGLGSGAACSDTLSLASLESALEGLPLILIARGDSVSVSALRKVLPLHPRALLSYPFTQDEFRSVLQEALSTSMVGRGDLEATLAETNRRLNERLQEINTVYSVGKSVTSSLDVAEVLERAVIASVNLTQADAGFIILRENDRLLVRVAKWRHTQPSAQLRDETSDSVAWRVIRSGRPVMLHEKTRIATGLLINALLYVPLQAPDKGTIGVLGVVNQVKDEPFTENQLFALSSVADFVGIALSNARLFSDRERERLRLSAILENAAEAIIVTDTADRLWVWSDTAARILGIDAQAQGLSVAECIESPEIRDLFTEASGDRPVLNSEVTLEDGRIYNAQLSTIHGVGRLVVMQEITRLKELDRLKSEFVSTVSHDLRTPLTTIQGYVELLNRAGPLNELQTSFVDKALSSLSHITDLISDLLDIGRIEAGYDLEMTSLRLDDLIRSAVEAAQVAAAQDGISVSLTLPDSPMWVWGNKRRLRQVLDNLIHNAIKYNRPEGWIEVLARRDADHFVVSVRDSGIGIPPQEQSRIFERFYRVQSAETEDVPGTGLGLAIVKSVVERHKGRIWVESVYGEGSTFTFVMPIHTS